MSALPTEVFLVSRLEPNVTFFPSVSVHGFFLLASAWQLFNTIVYQISKLAVAVFLLLLLLLLLMLLFFSSSAFRLYQTRSAKSRVHDIISN